MWRLLLLAGVVLASGCALLPTESASEVDHAEARADNPELSWRNRAAALTYLKRFTLEARLAVKGEGWGGNLRWTQNAEVIDLVVSGPLGVGALRAMGTLSRARIKSGSEDFWTDNPEATFRERIGWSLPLKDIRYWVLGVPTPGVPETHEIDAKGRLLRLHQQGWVIEYPEYQSAEYIELPRLMIVRGPRVEARVVIDDWKL